MIQIKCEICKVFGTKYSVPEATQFYLYKNKPYAVCGGHFVMNGNNFIDKEQYIRYKTFE